MAMANVAFLAAMNGHRVLMMDWDLEAPGLAYYFRGQLDASEQRALREAPGIMDIVYDWSKTVSSRKSAESNALLARFNRGAPFSDSVRPLMAQDVLPEGAALDYIGPGCKVAKHSDKKYEELLAEFSWPQFLNNEGGGIVLECLRNWSKNNYDYIFLDSRTGMADVAGICTMQLPDIVALCFILNRQNIDGVAKIAGAIRAERREQVQLRAAPMRLSRSATTEEADARARATTELTGVGGFSPEAIKEDFQSLGVALTESIPFYETLAPFVATDPALDPLTLNYVRLGSSLLGEQLKVPQIDEELVELVRRRLQPKHATAEYVAKLRSVQPERAAIELWGLIDNAFEATLNDESLEDEYLAVLVEMAMSFPETAVSAVDAGELQSRTIDLLRELSLRNPLKWRPALVRSAQRYYDIYSYVIDTDEELVLLEELDGLLAETPTLASRIKRIFYRRRAMSSYRRQNNNDAASQIIKEIREQKVSIPAELILAKDQMNQLMFAEVDALLVEADILADEMNLQEAVNIYRGLVERVAGWDFESEDEKNEAKSLQFHLYSALASDKFMVLIGDDAARARYALDAALTGRYGAVSQFHQLARTVTNAAMPQLSLDFLLATIGAPEYRSKKLYANVFGRQMRGAEQFFKYLTDLVSCVASIESDEKSLALEAAVETATGVLQNLRRRVRKPMGISMDAILESNVGLIMALQESGIEPTTVSPLAEIHNTCVSEWRINHLSP